MLEQVRNLRSCIKVALDFVAPEHVAHCVRLTEQLRELPGWHHRRQDVLSISSILYYSACACFAAFDEHKRRELARQEKQRRLDRKNSVSIDPPAAAATSKAVGGEDAAPAAASSTSIAMGEEVAAALGIVP